MAPPVRRQSPRRASTSVVKTAVMEANTKQSDTTTLKKASRQVEVKTPPKGRKAQGGGTSKTSKFANTKEEKEEEHSGGKDEYSLSCHIQPAATETVAMETNESASSKTDDEEVVHQNSNHISSTAVSPPIAATSEKHASRSTLLESVKERQEQVKSTQSFNNGTILRILARMYRQQADLCLKQASYLEQMSIQCTNNNSAQSLHQWENNVDQLMYNNYNNASDSNRNINNISIQHLPLPPSREDIQDKLRRELVIDLAKKSYEGMKEVQSVINILLQKNKTGNIQCRRKYAFEFFQDDIMAKIIKEDGFQLLFKGKKIKNDSTTSSISGKGGNDGEKEENEEKELQNYIFKRTQEEWKKLSKKSMKEYADRADSVEGIEHLKLQESLAKKMTTATAVATTKSTLSSRKETLKEQSTASNTNVGRKNGSKKRKLIRQEESIAEYENESDDGSDDRSDHSNNYQNPSSKDDRVSPTTHTSNDGSSSNNDSDSHSDSHSDSGSSAPSVDVVIQSKEDSMQKSNNGDLNGFNVPLILSQVPLSTPKKRERDEESSSSINDDGDDNDDELSALY